MKRILFIMFGAVGAASAGVFFAKDLLNFIPGLNDTVGGAINGATAASMTLAFLPLDGRMFSSWKNF